MGPQHWHTAWDSSPDVDNVKCNDVVDCMANEGSGPATATAKSEAGDADAVGMGHNREQSVGLCEVCIVAACPPCTHACQSSELNRVSLALPRPVGLPSTIYGVCIHSL